jgi:hypothetical protein
MDDLETSFVLLQLAPISYAALGMLVIPFVIYVIARWRAHRDQVVDPQLGIKVALGFFAVTAFQMLLAGATTFLLAIIGNSSSDAKSTLYRAGLGLVLAAGIVLGAHIALLARTNDEQYPTVRRLFAGYNLLVTGLLGFVALVLSFQALFHRGTASYGRFALSGLLVYGAAWIFLGMRFARLVLGTPGAAAPPMQMQPPGAPPVARPTKAEPGLPKLGQGAFPPISDQADKT